MRRASSGIMADSGGLGEWFKPAVLKTAEQKCSVSSNLTASANLWQVVEVVMQPLFARFDQPIFPCQPTVNCNVIFWFFKDL